MTDKKRRQNFCSRRKVPMPACRTGRDKIVQERSERLSCGDILSKRRLNSHKGDYGHVLVLAGSKGLTGAAVLCSQAALFSGSGLVTLGCPRSLNPIMEEKLTEVMTKALNETEDLSLSIEAEEEILGLVKDVDSIAIGPGLSRNQETQLLIRRLICLIDKPMILDADGINALVGNLEILKKAESSIPLVLTPHPGELARLINLAVTRVQENRESLAKGFAKEHAVIIALKGHRTMVASPEGKIYINKTGNPGMATGGSGDILTGMIASFLGQGMAPFQATRLAVHIHGLAGDLAAKEKGEVSLIATDILNKLPEAIKSVQ